MKAYRDSIDAHTRANASWRAMQMIKQLPLYREAKAYLAYVPFGSELNIMPLLDDPGHGKQVYVPRARFVTRTLELCPYPCTFDWTSYGLAQPTGDVIALEDDWVDATLDLVLVPAVAFSRSTRHRLGYGGGFYDVFFSRHDVPAIGVGFSFQLLQAVPYSDLDLPMDMLVTEDEVIRS
jgi:5-formyltetrahydrofolate cyclo-ligase